MTDLRGGFVFVEDGEQRCPTDIRTATRDDDDSICK